MQNLEKFLEATSHKLKSLQATSGCNLRLQATSNKRRSPQASSAKRGKIQAASIKRQANRIFRIKSVFNKCQDTSTWKQFARALTGLLGKYKCVVWMFNMEGNLMWREPNFVTGCYLQLNSEKLARIIIPQ